MTPQKKKQRFSISVSGTTYDRLRSAVPLGGVSSFVDDIVLGALDDPAILRRLIDRCRQEDELS